MMMLNRENEKKMTTLRKTRYDYRETSLEEKTAKNKPKDNPPPKKKPPPRKQANENQTLKTQSLGENEYMAS